MKNPPHPSGLIKETLDFINMSRLEFEEELNLPSQEAHELLDNNGMINEAIAEKLVTILGGSASLWVGMYNAYKESIKNEVKP